jgi:hypothetical protein
MEDIIIRSDTFYDTNKKTFENTIPTDAVYEIINEPVIVMETLHGCYSHAIIDSCFPIFWIIDDLITSKKINDKNVKIFIKEKLVLEYAVLNLPLIDSTAQTYKGVFKNIIELITPFPLLFQHTLKTHYVFKNCFFYPENDRWQRTPWNCVDYYPARNIPKHAIRFSDTLIYDKMLNFRNLVLDKIKPSTTISDRILIIDRQSNRKMDPVKLQNLMKTEKCDTVILENKTFEAQVKLFAEHRIFICRHGSSEINLLWIPMNSIVFELEGGRQGLRYPTMYKRISSLTNSTHYLLNYDTYDTVKDIFDKI